MVLERAAPVMRAAVVMPLRCMNFLRVIDKSATQIGVRGS
jgi:hypothetical protein